MRGINDVSYSGNVGHVASTTTHMKGDPICTFMVCSEKETNFATWAKCTAYGKLAEYCSDKISKGDYVIVSGELFNKKSRNSPHPELEIKVTKKIVIINRETFNSKELTDLFLDIKEAGGATERHLSRLTEIASSSVVDTY